MELIAPIRYVNTVMPDTMQNMETRRSGVLVALMSPYLQAASALDLVTSSQKQSGRPKQESDDSCHDSLTNMNATGCGSTGDDSHAVHALNAF